MKLTLVFTTLAFVVTTAFGTRLESSELNPSCLEASKAKVFRAFDHKIHDAISDFDHYREKLGLKEKINWDGAAVNHFLTHPEGEIPGDLFLFGARKRQIKFTEPLTASRDSFKSLFHGKDVGANPFSTRVNVAPLDSNKVTVSFTLDDKKTAGLVNGFGAIFTDVETDHSSGLVFYDAAGAEIKKVFAKKRGNGKHQFLGVLFDETVVASVGIVFGDNGNLDKGRHEGTHGNDFVVVDDFFFLRSDTEVPAVTYRGQVEDRDEDEILKNFQRRRIALDQKQITNINWDGKAVTDLTHGGTAELPRDLFLESRQVTIAGAHEKVFASEDEFGFLGQHFGFGAFTPNVTFASKGKQITIEFFLEDGHTEGLVHGFGAIFTDVEQFKKTGLTAYDKYGKIITDVRARPEKNGESQFIGVMLNKPEIAKVVLDMGDNDKLFDHTGNQGLDVVVVDDWLFFKSTTKA